MNNNEIMQKIIDIEKEIEALPPGSIVTKRIKGRNYYYHRVTINKKRTETYLSFEDAEKLRPLIEKRKSLENELKLLRHMSPQASGAAVRVPLQAYGPGDRLSPSGPDAADSHEFKTYARTGIRLISFASGVKNYKKRECFEKLYDFVYNEHRDKVFILYGLRRTGKTTLIRQLLAEMSETDIRLSAFIQVKASDTLSDVNVDLKYLEEHGYRYVFIDEVTLLDDFIEGAALFSDIFASSGMKIVLSGTDSLGFMLSEDDQLYDRCIMLHTTFIPYREFERVLGIRGIDEYIRYGGTMSISGANYNQDSIFANSRNAGEYIDSAIAKNIQHSLKHYRYGGHFRHLLDLYERGELTSAINRVVEDINHRFTVDVLTKTFQSNDLSISANNLLHDRERPVDLRSHIDQTAVTEALRKALEILNKEERSVEIDAAHASQIKEYLALLDLIVDIDAVYLPDVDRRGKITVITQPGMRYAQADALIGSLLLDKTFYSLSAAERSCVLERIRSEIMGRMMEDIVLLETKTACPDRQVFRLQFAVGEFDMVIFDPASLTCDIFEIKHSKEVSPGQYRHLTDAEKCSETEHRFGNITGKYVIYRGSELQRDGISYLNVEKYLNSL